MSTPHRLARACFFAIASAVAACGSGDGGGSGAGGGSASDGSSTPASGSSGGGAHDTWNDYAEGFFTTYCVECHDASDTTGRDFRSLAIVVTNASTIRCGVTPIALADCQGFPPPKQFPIDDPAGTNPKPSDAERTRLVDWIQAGTP